MSNEEACRLAFEKWAARADAQNCPVVATLDRVYRPFLAASARAAAVEIEVAICPFGLAVRIRPRPVI
jgi:hypothetical protein